MRILLAVDGSGHSEAAIDDIARRIFPANSAVCVLSVVEPPYFPGVFSADGVNMSLFHEIETTARERARAAVEKAAATLRGGDGKGGPLAVTTEVRSGSPKNLILEESEAFDADLIVVGSHGQGRLERFLLGSVAQAVALHARCSVEIIRTRGEASPALP